MRVDRYISRATGMSRSEVHRAIRQKRVILQGQALKSPATVLTDSPELLLDGQLVRIPEHCYLMLHKPAGTVCSNNDPTHPTVLDLLNSSQLNIPGRPLQMAGRLDLDTTGLVLITTDGDWNHRVTSPRRTCQKVYRVDLDRPLTDSDLKSLEIGIQLRSEARLTRPCSIQRKSETCLNMTLSEGKYHQVKRMFAAVGYHVVNLHREQIGAIRLDEALPPGHYRALTLPEIGSVSTQ